MLMSVNARAKMDINSSTLVINYEGNIIDTFCYYLKCLLLSVFDASIEDSPEYRSIHEEYRKLVS